MDILFDTESVNYIMLDGKKSNFESLDEKLSSLVKSKGLDIQEYSLSNKYLRAIVKRNGFEYHILEKAKGVNNILCVGSDMKKKSVKIDMPYTILIVKLVYLNGKYIKKGDRIFHSDTPVKKDLSNSLWRWGLSNVYDSHYICWGKEKLPDIDNSETYRYIDEFFLGVKNNDLLKNPEINWAEMDSETVYTVSLSRLPKLHFNLNEVFDLGEF